MKRTRAYRRFQRRRTIKRKKNLSMRIYGMDWFQGIDGKYSKGHVGCGCWLCKPGKRFRRPSIADERKSMLYKHDILDYWRGGFELLSYSPVGSHDSNLIIQ